MGEGRGEGAVGCRLDKRLHKAVFGYGTECYAWQQRPLYKPSGHAEAATRCLLFVHVGTTPEMPSHLAGGHLVIRQTVCAAVFISWHQAQPGSSEEVLTTAPYLSWHSRRF